jgi:hypothetical protein
VSAKPDSLDRLQQEIERRKPRPKRVRPAPVKRDPVITALIAKLPPEGARFDRPQRVNLLRMFAMAFDGAFGVQLPIAIDAAAELVITGGPIDMPSILAPSKPQPISAPAEEDEIRYFVDQDGFARKEPGGARIKPHEIPPGFSLEDEREGDGELDTIKWADGVWPPGAYPNPLTIVKA